MERQITDLEYSNTDATVEQVKAAIRAAKVIMSNRTVQASQRIPCISDGSAVCLHDGDGRACAFDRAAVHDAGGI